MATDNYNASEPSRYSRAGIEPFIGRRATLTLEGEIIGVGESNAGAFVKFKLDERFGFGGSVFGLDFDLLTLHIEP